tara:strand:+ start:4680 stop:5768 length:1089 start_codon:yes stop_codon:yes gene_type:complete
MHTFFASYYMSVISVPESLFGQTEWIIGFIVGVMGITGMLTRPVVGVLIDANFPKKLFLIIGAIGVGISFLGYSSTNNLFAIGALRLLQGTSTAMFTTTLSVVVSEYVPTTKRGVGLGIFQSSSALSQVYAALFAVWLIENFSLETGFTASALFAFLAGIFALFLKIDYNKTHSKGFDFKNAQWISKHGLYPFLIFTSQTLTFGAIIAFLPSISQARDLGNPGIFYTVLALTMLVVRSLSGYLSDVIGRKLVIVPALMCSTFALILIAFTQTQIILILASIFYGIGFASVQVVGFAILIDTTPVQYHGSGLATYTNAWDVGGLLGGLAIGILIEFFNFTSAFIFCSCLPIFALFLLRKIKLD